MMSDSISSVRPFFLTSSPPTSLSQSGFCDKPFRLLGFVIAMVLLLSNYILAV